MLNFKQYKFWYGIFREDPELADQVLREYQRQKELLANLTPEAALDAILADDAKAPSGFPDRRDALVHQLQCLE